MIFFFILSIIFLSFITLLDFENLHHLLHLNGNMNGTLVDSNLGKEIVLDITVFLNKQNVTGYDHSQSHLGEKGNDLFSLNG